MERKLALPNSKGGSELKNNYVSANPQALLLLKACWAGLALSILLGVVALFGEAQTPLDAVNNIRKDRKELGDEATARKLTKNSGTMPKKRYIYAQKTLYYSLHGIGYCLPVISSV